MRRQKSVRVDSTRSKARNVRLPRCSRRSDAITRDDSDRPLTISLLESMHA
jgi:hypothetical protein